MIYKPCASLRQNYCFENSFGEAPTIVERGFQFHTKDFGEVKTAYL